MNRISINHPAVGAKGIDDYRAVSASRSAKGRLNPSPREFFPRVDGGFASRPHQRVAGLEFREHGKVAVSGPKFADAVVQAQRGDARIVDARTG